MNNQKFFLLTAIALSVFLLWDKWQIEQNPAPAVAPTTQAAQTPTTNTPVVTQTTPSAEVPTLTNSAQTDVPSSASKTPVLVTVETDLLHVEINEHSTITRATLKQYPTQINSTENIQLLDDSNNRFFIAEGGLAPQGIVPTHIDNWSAAQSHYTLNGKSLVVPLTWEKDGITVIKNLIFTQNSYLIQVHYDITNNSNKAINVLSYSRLSRKKLKRGGSLSMRAFSGGAIYNDEEVYEKFKFDEFAGRPKITTQGGFAAQVEHYFIGAIIPNQEQQNTFSSKVVNGNYILENIDPTQTITPGTSTTLLADSFYVGPKEKDRIEKVTPGLDHTVDYSWLYIIAKPLAEFIYWIYSLVGSWGLSIILLTISVKLVFYKLSEKSYKSMAGMRKLAPRLEALKEKYGDDRVAMGRKTMELYKEAKVNPASGCLPILVQMPVFISLYWVLSEVVELRHTPFLYLPDLSAADPYYILPILMGITMFIQQKLNPKPSDPMQAKIMMTLPIIFTVFFLWFPSGLVLYWLFNNILSIVQQWVITKRIAGNV